MSDSSRNFGPAATPAASNTPGIALIRPILELTAIALFAVWVGRDYLDFDSRVVPFGREFMMVIQSNNLWNMVKECGWCALWNGSTSGGYPAAAELFGAPLHPIVAVTILIWGVINGTKAALIASLMVAGLAQWWLAHELRVSWIPRIWSALIAVAGGHLAGRMGIDDGAFTILLSTAVTSLVFPAVLAVDRTASRGSVVVLSLVVASAILSGQGYLQLGLLASSPAILFLLLDSRLSLKPIWRKYALACGLSVLLSAPFLVPLLHFLPNFGKPIDPTFRTAPSLELLPLNLVIRDFSVSQLTASPLIAISAPYTLFVGWVPVIMAVIGVGLARSDSRRRIFYLASGAILIFLIGSDAILKPVAEFIPAAAAIRFPGFTAGLAVPLLLGIGAYGLDRLLQMEWPNISLRLQKSGMGDSRGISLRWGLIIPLLLSIQSSSTYAHNRLNISHQGDDVPWVLEALKTPELEWVSPPFGEHYFVTPAIVSGLKISPGLKPWGWKEREAPIPRVEAGRGSAPPGATETLGESFGIFVYLREAEHYAAVMNEAGVEACQASGLGGSITVVCIAGEAGRLVVKENMWTGWKASRDGRAVPLLGDQWLEVEAPVGRHEYEFKYRPWDVPLGLSLMVLGLILCGMTWYGLIPPGWDQTRFRAPDTGRGSE